MDSFLTPAIVSTIITGILAPMIFYYLKRRDEEKKRNFDVRYAEYKHYLKTLDEITAAVQLDAEKFYTETIADTFRSILSGEEDGDAVLIKMSDSLMSMTANIQKTFSRAEGELHGLKLVCSDELLEMIDEYVELQRELLSAVTRMMENWRNIDMSNPITSLNGEVKDKGDRAQMLYTAILKQMRKELKIK